MSDKMKRFPDFDDVTICTYGRQWKHARIVGTGKDNLTGHHPIYIVQHPHFGEVHFYQMPSTTEEHRGQYLNVGNAAFWLILE